MQKMKKSAHFWGGNEKSGGRRPVERLSSAVKRKGLEEMKRVTAVLMAMMMLFSPLQSTAWAMQAAGRQASAESEQEATAAESTAEPAIEPTKEATTEPTAAEPTPQWTASPVPAPIRISFSVEVPEGLELPEIEVRYVVKGTGETGSLGMIAPENGVYQAEDKAGEERAYFAILPPLEGAVWENSWEQMTEDGKKAVLLSEPGMVIRASAEPVHFTFTLTGESAYPELQFHAPDAGEIQLEYQDQGGLWNPLSAEIQAENGTYSVTDSTASPGREYRVNLPDGAAFAHPADNPLPIEKAGQNVFVYTLKNDAVETKTFSVLVDTSGNAQANLTSDQVKSLIEKVTFADEKGEDCPLDLTVSARSLSVTEQQDGYVVSLDAAKKSGVYKAQMKKVKGFTLNPSGLQNIETGFVYTAVEPNAVSFDVRWEDQFEGTAITTYRPAPETFSEYFEIQYTDDGTWDDPKPAEGQSVVRADGNVWTVSYTDQQPDGKDRKYRVVPKDVPYYQALQDKTPVELTEENPVTIIYWKPEPQRIQFEINWNDNHNQQLDWNEQGDQGRRPPVTDAAFLDGLKIAFSDDEGLNWTDFSGNVTASEKDKSSWTAEFTDPWPLSASRQYVLKEVGIPSGYQLTAEEDHPPIPLSAAGEAGRISFTALRDFEIYVQFRDEGSQARRPIQGETGIELLKKLGMDGLLCGDEEKAWPAGTTAVLDAAGKVTIHVPALPAFAPNGSEYVYSVGLPAVEPEPEEEPPVENKQDTYEQEVENVRNHFGQQERIYNRGTLNLRLSGLTEFVFNKKWRDAASTMRPETTLYLYRFVQGEEMGEYPVRGKDSMTIQAHEKPESEADETFGGRFVYSVNGSELPRYDDEGRKYVYFVKEVMKNPGDYQQEIQHSGQAEQDYIFRNDTVINALRKKAPVQATKRFEAQALQGMAASAEFALQRLNERTKLWETVQTTVDDPTEGVVHPEFDAQHMTHTVSFPNIDLYDEQGAAIQYRIAETKVTIRNGDKTAVGIVPERAEDGVPQRYDVTGEDGETYMFEVVYSGDQIVNRLVEKIRFCIRKIWNEPLPEGVYGTIKTKVYRSVRGGGKEEYPLEDVNLPANDTGTTAVYEDGVLSLTGGNGMEYTLAELPLYDENGYRFTYTVEEDKEPIEVQLQDGTMRRYSFYDMDYRVDADGTRAGVLTNTSGTGGEGQLRFLVKKRWKDDNDLLHRRKVNLGLYYRDPLTGNVEQVKAYHLEDENQFQTYMHYTPMEENEQGEFVPISGENNPRGQYENYFICEDSLGENAEYEVAYADDARTSGTVKTDEHIYNVDVQNLGVSQTAMQYEVTNTRVGTVTIQLEKRWAVDSVPAEALYAEFKMTADGLEVTNENRNVYFEKPNEAPDFPIQMPLEGGGTLYIGPLKKYDENGRAIAYSMEESSLHYTNAQGEEETVQFVDSAVEIPSLAGGAFTIYSTAVPIPYQEGRWHTDDTFGWQFHNRLRERREVTVNKVWHDDGQSQNRPDIGLRLYRTIHENEMGDTQAAERVQADRLWDTRHNEWYWTCSFGKQEVFDSAGNAYFYFVTEYYPSGSAMYESVCINGAGRPHAGGTNAEETFAPVAGTDDYAKAGWTAEEAGVILNTRRDKMNIRGRKIWKNVAGTEASDLPTVMMDVYRRTGQQEAPKPEPHESPCRTVTLRPEENWAYKLPKLEKYDPYGRAYTYFVEERMESADGKLKEQDFFTEGIYTKDENGFDVTNVYQGGEGVSFSVQKTWNWNQFAALVDGGPYPPVTFRLIQMDNGRETKSVTLEMEAGEIQLGEGQTTTVLQAQRFKDGEKEVFPYYAPSGRVYRYIITEKMDPKAQNAYQTRPNVAGSVPVEGEIVVYDSMKDSAYKDAVNVECSVENIYTPQRMNLQAVKIWDDQSNRYGLRPAFSKQNDGELTYTFFRKNPDTGKRKALNDRAERIEWKENSNTWVCTLEGPEVLVYTTTGSAYEYDVEEKMDARYDLVYPPEWRTQPGSRMKWKNKMQTVSLHVRKDWKGEIEGGPEQVDLNGRQLEEYFGLLDRKTDDIQLTFELGWNSDIPETMFQQFEMTKTVPFKANGVYNDLFRNLPAYYKDAQGNLKPMVYTVKETKVCFQGDGEHVALVPEHSDLGAVKPGENDVHSFTNTLPVIRAELVKAWENQGDTVPVTYTLKSGTGKAVDIQLNAPWSYTVYLPKGETYTLTEDVPAGYAAAYTIDAEKKTPIADQAPAQMHISGEKNGKYGFINEKRLNIQAAKVWNDEKLIEAHTGYERPEKIRFVLERSVNGREWEEAAEPIELSAPAHDPNADWETLHGTWKDLPAYEHTGYPENIGMCRAYRYRVGEEMFGGAGWIAPEEAGYISTPVGDGFTIRNTPMQYRLSVQKVWQGDLGYEADRPDIWVELQAATNPRSPSWVTLQAFKLTALNGWKAEFDVPMLRSGGEQLFYRFVETGDYPGYEIQNAQTPIFFKEGSGTLTNALEPLNIEVQKSWTGDENWLNTALDPRPKAIQLTLWRTENGTDWEKNPVEPTKMASAATDWKAAWTGLPRYAQREEGTRAAYQYKVVETPVSGYETACSEKAPVDEADKMPVSMEIRNTFCPAEIQVTKVWKGDGECGSVSGIKTRPTEAEAEIQYSVDGKTFVPVEFADGQTARVMLTEQKDWKHTWTGLPACTGEGQKIIYRVSESRHNGYDGTDGMAAPEPGQRGEVEITNTLKTFPLAVQKKWVNDEEALKDRPTEIFVKAQYKLEGETAWKELSQDGVYTLTGPAWNAVYEGAVPCFDARGQLIQYRFVECGENGQNCAESGASPGYPHYTVTSSSLITPDAATEEKQTQEITNTWDGIDLTGKKIWNDGDNRWQVRPEQIQLTVLADGKPLEPQPEFVFEKGENEWVYRAKGLPKRHADGTKIETYTVMETEADGYRAEKAIAQAPCQDGVLMAEDLVNTLTGFLEIDNVTPNAATGETNAGGFVGREKEESRDLLAYEPDGEGKTSVSWKAEPGWQCDGEPSVFWQEHGSDEMQEGGLKARFPNAQLTEDDGVYTLKLAGSAEEMPYKTRVEVRFCPTLAVENTTREDKLGEVAAKEGGEWNRAYDGRCVSSAVYAKAARDCMVDLEHIQIGGVGTVEGTYAQNVEAVRLGGAEQFGASVSAALAGKTEMVEVSGSVTVLERDASGNPTQVQVRVDALPACLDIGIPFKRVEVPDDIAKTGDPLYTVLMLACLSGIGLMMLHAAERHRKKKK